MDGGEDTPDRQAEHRPAPDPVDESIKDSFPASDPPSWWAGHEVAARPERPDPKTGAPPPNRFGSAQKGMGVDDPIPGEQQS